MNRVKVITTIQRVTLKDIAIKTRMHGHGDDAVDIVAQKFYSNAKRVTSRIGKPRKLKPIQLNESSYTKQRRRY